LPFFNYQTGDHPQEELAKFGYRPDVKEEFLNNPFIFWLPAGTCCTDLAGDFSSFLQNLAKLGPFFTPKKKIPLYVLKSYFSGQKKYEFFFQTPPPPPPQKNEHCQ